MSDHHGKHQRTASGLHPCDFGRARYPKRERARALSDLARLRKEASAEITRLIVFLQSDPYVMTEREDDDHREDCGDTEPSLGSLDRANDQTRWGAGCPDDAEHEHDGREPDEDRRRLFCRNSSASGQYRIVCCLSSSHSVE